MQPRRTILIVEDDDDLRRLFRMTLALAGYDTVEAPNGYVALTAVEHTTLSAIILDLGLPAISGHVVLQELAARAITHQIPVIVVTGQDVDSAPGAACVLKKPVVPEKLLRTVRSCIAAGAAGTSIFDHDA